MPLDMLESVLVRLRARCSQESPCVIWYMRFPTMPFKKAPDCREKRQEEHLLGPYLEIEGLEDLTVEQAFELSDASAERLLAVAPLSF